VVYTLDYTNVECSQSKPGEICDLTLEVEKDSDDNLIYSEAVLIIATKTGIVVQIESLNHEQVAKEFGWMEETFIKDLAQAVTNDWPDASEAHGRAGHEYD